MIFKRVFFFMISGPPGFATKFLLFSTDLRQWWYKKIRYILVKITLKRSTNIFMTKSTQAANLPLDNGEFFERRRVRSGSRTSSKAEKTNV